MSEANSEPEETAETPSEAPPEAVEAAQVVEIVDEDPTAELKAEVGKLKDQLLRTAADYDNFRKRTRKDLQEARRKGQETALLEVLPVADNLERALAATNQSTDVSSVIEGLQMVLKGLEDALQRLGVERVQALGMPFDPALHEAIQHRETDETPPGTVVDEMMSGYRLGEKLLRAAMVAVAKAPAAAAADEAQDAPKADDESPDSGAEGDTQD